MHMVVCAFYRAVLSVSKRRRSLVFVVIIADECEKKRTENRANKWNEKRERKQTKRKEHTRSPYKQSHGLIGLAADEVLR